MLSFLTAAMLIYQPKVDADVVYRKVGERELKMDFYHPVGDAAGPAPLVIAIHGGAWVSGDKKDMGGMCTALAQAGFACATVQYRLAPASRWPAQLDDVQAAVRAARARATEFKIDPERIAATGASAGGHLALLLGSRDTRDTSAENQNLSSRVKAVLNVFGPTDLSKDYEPNLANLISFQLMGKRLSEAGDVMKEGSPVTWITAKSAPVFTIHGTADRIVPVKQAVRLDDVLREKKVEHVMRLIPDMDHQSPMDKPEGAKAMAEALTWLKGKLGLS
jgi:acetyl esterase/lipase